LSREDTVESVEGERTLAIQEVGDMRLAEAGLPSEASSSESAEFNAVDQFEAEVFVKILKIHRVRFSCGRTISSCKTKIKRNIAIGNVFREFRSKLH
jgi:hypothetical protein